MRNETTEETRERPDAFMEEAAHRVAEWPGWKRSIKIMDRHRQCNRHEPTPE